MNIELPKIMQPVPHRREVAYYARILSAKLAQLGFCYRPAKGHKIFVRFDGAATSDQVVALRIDTAHLPRGVRVSELAEKDVLDDLGLVCEREVEYVGSREAGAWLLIYRDGSAERIPSEVPWASVMESWPRSSTKTPPLVPLGVGANRRLIFKSLSEMPHALVGGATGAGKTTLLHAWICGIITHYAPAEIQLALIDMKGGVEFIRYRQIPHLYPGGFVKAREEAPALLGRLHAEMDRRLSIFEQAGGIQNLSEYNYRHRARALPRIIVIIDEVSSVMLDPRLRKESVPVLVGLAERGRAPGLHLVVATQRPVKAVVDTQVKGNLDARFAFRMADDDSSAVILDDVSAARLPARTPLGRYIYKRGLDRTEIQAPLITAPQIDQVLKDLQQPTVIIERSDVTAQEIFETALRLNGGRLSRQRLHKLTEGRISEKLITKIVQEYEGQEIEISGKRYTLQRVSKRDDGAFSVVQLVPVS